MVQNVVFMCAGLSFSSLLNDLTKDVVHLHTSFVTFPTGNGM